MNFIEGDFETRSSLDVSEVGPNVYANHPSTEVICFNYKINDGPVRRWLPEFEQMPYDLHMALIDQEAYFVAHNIGFEINIWNYCLRKKYLQHFNYIPILEIKRVTCSASLARSLSLPSKLVDLASALKLTNQKDMEGHKVMLRASRPKADGSFDKSEETLNRLYEYCDQDVRTESAAYAYCLPYKKETEFERAVFELDLKINLRGFCVDVDLLHRCISLLESELERYKDAPHRLSFGFLTSFNQREKTLQLVKSFDHTIMDLKKGTVDVLLLKKDLDPALREILEVRQITSKTSTAKFYAFRDRLGAGNRIRDILMYHTASTGRWGGSGVQPQNFPRGTIKDVALAIELILADDLKQLRFLFGENLMPILSSSLRGLIVAAPGHELFCADYAQIEARVLFWLAGEQKGLTAFREGQDIYRQMASVIYKIHLDLVTEDQRQLGKQAVLGAGFQMGPDRFKTTCLGYGIEVSDELAETAIRAYRDHYDKVPDFWAALEDAAILAVRNPGKKYKTSQVMFYVEGDFLFCDLPSGRRLAYHKPGVEMKRVKFKKKVKRIVKGVETIVVKEEYFDKFCLRYWAVNSTTKKYQKEFSYGGKLAENVVQATARDLMANAMLNCEAAGYKVVLTVHDELLTEKESGPGVSLKYFDQIMQLTPRWAEGLPVKHESWTGKRYRK